jgi:uncharacterized protein
VTTAYIESSALVKLVLDERESARLRRALLTHEHRVASDLATVEVMRAAGRARGDDGVARARAAFLSIESIAVDRSVIESASTLEPFELRSLDAIHVATAIALTRHDVVFYSYDQRALDAARTAGLSTASP